MYESVITKELVFADNLLAELDVIPGSGITCGLQGQKPVVIVSRGIAMAAFVTVGHQQSGMMVDAFLDSGVACGFQGQEPVVIIGRGIAMLSLIHI